MAVRELEPGMQGDQDRRQSYANYLQLDKILGAQQPLSKPQHHDEMLFIIQHQVAELWFKLIIHELQAAQAAFREDALNRATKILSRVRNIQHQLYSQWAVLSTLTPSEYAEFRHVFGDASGFQSPQYRIVEFLLGHRDPAMLKLHNANETWYAAMEAAASSPSVFDEFLIALCRRGFDIPTICTERDFAGERAVSAAVVATLKKIYENTETYWSEYEICEALMDVANNFQFWRYHHMKTVERIIGHKRGTGGSSGVAFLKRALDIEFFPELIHVRTEIGAG